jgi:phage shock protein PspC (stress-responsive transcriptional regulator)
MSTVREGALMTALARPVRPGLVRPREGRVIGGVCAALAQRFGTSATTMRVIFLVSCLLPGPQFLLYLALWVLLPGEKSPRETW